MFEFDWRAKRPCGGIIEAANLAQAHLAEECPLRRAAPRPLNLRQKGYDAAFDDQTLFYDAFLGREEGEVRLVGPPFLNLRPLLEQAEISLTSALGRTIPVLDVAVYELNKVGVVRIRSSARAPKYVHLNLGPLGQHRLRINPSGLDLYRGQHVAFTLFKYEPLSWLRDWAEFNIGCHGVNALLLYHNSSTRYSSREIWHGMKSVKGLDVLTVVHWPFKYGPQAAGTGYWDSNFCQLGMMEHARRRFLTEAAGVLNGDIDELVTTSDQRSVFDHLTQSGAAWIDIEGIAISDSGAGADASPIEARRHRYYRKKGRAPGERDMGRKWVLDPSRCPENAQWMVHQVKKAQCERADPDHLQMNHFVDINASWKAGTDVKLKDLEPALQLQRAFSKMGWD